MKNFLIICLVTMLSIPCFSLVTSLGLVKLQWRDPNTDEIFTHFVYLLGDTHISHYLLDDQGKESDKRLIKLLISFSKGQKLRVPLLVEYPCKYEPSVTLYKIRSNIFPQASQPGMHTCAFGISLLAKSFSGLRFVPSDTLRRAPDKALRFIEPYFTNEKEKNKILSDLGAFRNKVSEVIDYSNEMWLKLKALKKKKEGAIMNRINRLAELEPAAAEAIYTEIKDNLEAAHSFSKLVAIKANELLTLAKSTLKKMKLEPDPNKLLQIHKDFEKESRKVENPFIAYPNNPLENPYYLNIHRLTDLETILNIFYQFVVKKEKLSIVYLGSNHTYNIATILENIFKGIRKHWGKTPGSFVNNANEEQKPPTPEMLSNFLIHALGVGRNFIGPDSSIDIDLEDDESKMNPKNMFPEAFKKRAQEKKADDGLLQDSDNADAEEDDIEEAEMPDVVVEEDDIEEVEMPDVVKVAR